MEASRYLAFSLAWSVFAAGDLWSSEPEALTVDLDGDGRAERIDWVKFAETNNEGDFYQVRVTENAGGLLWEGPKVADTGNPLVFGSWHFGVSLPELAADIDGDGKIEMVTPAPQSDVSPTYFRVLRWTDGRFVPTRSGILLESPRGTGKFPWSEAEEWEGTWISSFLGRDKDGTLRVQLFEYQGGVDAKIGVASIRPVAGGFEIAKWLEPMKSAAEPEDLGNTRPGAVNNVVYRTRLGARDHFNSQGKRLETVADVLRQDRANFHLGKGDEEDGGDPLFGTREARNSMDTKQPRPVAGDAEAWRKAIVNGTPLVEVEVGSKILSVRILEP